MKIVCVGAGPAGLYFSILTKLADRDHDVTVLERKPAGAPTGWGVVFWNDLLDDLHATDPETARRIRAAAVQWRGQALDVEGAVVDHEGCGYGIGRSKLVEILVERATELGVDVRFDHAVTSDTPLSGADVVVAADGVNSTLREREPDVFGTSVAKGRNKYLWLGTPRLFEHFTFAFVHTPAGWIWSHAYAYDERMSTFIVECAPETWSGLGLDALDASEGLRALEDIFAKQLEGEPLYSLDCDATLPWLEFRTLTNARWHSGNTVLMGDAAHTTHFSIGSGTRLAMQDAIALAAALREHESPEAAFAAYEEARRRALMRPQNEARFSARWFEEVPRYAGLPGPTFFALLRARRDPMLTRVPPKLYAWAYTTADRIAFTRKLKRAIGPKVRAFQTQRSQKATPLRSS